MREIEFVIPGEPVGKGRPRFNSETGAVYTPKKTSEYEEYVQLCFLKYGKGWKMTDGPVFIEVEACFRIPKSASKKDREAMREGKILPRKKPDCDNILKAVSDALNGLAYNDDRQIVKAVVSKNYSKGEGFVMVKIMALE